MDTRNCRKCGQPYSTLKCGPCRKQYRKDYHTRNRAKYRAYCKQWRQKNPSRAKNMGLSYRRDLKLDVLTHYSGGPPKCACPGCEGNNFLEFLCLDHEYGGGNIHRKELNRSGTRFYTWIRKNGYPPGFRVLCHNCNQAIGSFGCCPHMATKKVVHGLDGTTVYVTRTLKAQSLFPVPPGRP